MSRWLGAAALIAAAAMMPAMAQERSDVPPAPTNLRTEYLTNPMGIDVVHPRFSWVLHHPDRGEKQTAYRILVSTRPNTVIGDQWDSGKVESEQSTQVPYAGKPLLSGHTYYWRVRSWDKEGRESEYSNIARFEMGLLSASEWKGRWIGGGNELRKEFTLQSRPVRARAYVSGIGYYELHVNGKKVGNHVLDPAWTTYDKRVLYATYDITPLLHEGANAIGMMLGQGWYGSRAAMLQVNIELADGRTFEVMSDGSWKVTQGPIVSDSIYNGETFDARKEAPGWDRPGFNDTGWQMATLVEAPKGVLSAEMMPPIRVVDTIVPFKMTEPRPGVYVFDMGQNFSGWVQLRVQGPRGTRVRLRHSELLYKDGTLNVENLRRAKATDVYILRGDGQDEIYQPHFTYHGFRYVELTGYPGTPRMDTIRGKVVHSAVTPIGNFSSSKPILNELQRLILWGGVSDLFGVPTDCNQRDERRGWMGDAQLFAETAMFNFDMAAFYTNFLRDIHDAQGPNGEVPDTVPFTVGRRPGDPAWGAAYPLIVWYVYEYQGDRRILEEHYSGVKAWTDYQRSRSQNGLLTYSYYGDWVPIVPTPGDLVSTFYYYYSAELTSRMANILGKKVDAAQYQKLADQIREAFNRKFWNADTRSYGNGSQTSQILALYLNLASKDRQGPAFGHLVNDIVYGHNTHLTTGIIGTKYLPEILTMRGRTDLAYDLATRTTYPGWGYMIENGATTLWELWQNKTGPAMNSHNHVMFGSIGAWMYKALAGIDLDPEKPGYRHIRFEPQVTRDLRWCSGSVDTLRGKVASSWRRGDHTLHLEVDIPVGSDAEIHIPKLMMDDLVIRESGHVVWENETYQPGDAGLTGATQTSDAVIFQAGSGHYVFDLTGS